MMLPGGQVFGAVDADAAAFFLSFHFVLAEPPELGAGLVEADATGVGVDQVAVGVAPPRARDDVPRRDGNGARGDENGGQPHGNPRGMTVKEKREDTESYDVVVVVHKFWVYFLK